MHVPRNTLTHILLLNSVINFTITVTVPVWTFWTPVPPHFSKSGEGLPLEIETFSSTYSGSFPVISSRCYYVQWLVVGIWETDVEHWETLSSGF